MSSNIINDIFTIGGETLAKRMRDLNESLPMLLKTSLPIRKDLEPRLRKLVAFPDKEGKTRIIGILDYFSQTA
jgi:tetrahydromethanopterin S-methyltransferase subunit B